MLSLNLKKRDLIPGLTLKICGGYTGSDKQFHLSANKEDKRKQT